MSPIANTKPLVHKKEPGEKTKVQGPLVVPLWDIHLGKMRNKAGKITYPPKYNRIQDRGIQPQEPLKRTEKVFLNTWHARIF